MKVSNPEEVYKEDGTRDELASRINHAANRYSKGSKVTIYVLGPNGYETMDVTQEVEKIDEEKQQKKYDDIDYLADRANMKRDDPRFDPDFWRMYFKNVDEKRGMTPARKLGKVMNWDEET
jgi:hypothetical protein